MKICRYDDDRLGLVEGNQVRDVSAVLAAIPSVRWPVPLGDPLIARLPELREQMTELTMTTPVIPLDKVRLRSPITSPSKIIGAPVNYSKHLDESRADAEIHAGQPIKTIDEYGVFLKANSALVGPADGITLGFSDRRTDHEVELCAVIGKHGKHIARDDAMDYVAGYCIGIDATVRGGEDRSYRKSLDTFAVIGPWIVTADEIVDPGNLDLSLTVNGELRQQSNTRHMIFDLPRLIEYASRAYTLYPGDVLMTGTPEGVGEIREGDVIEAAISGIGAMTVSVRADNH